MSTLTVSNIKATGETASRAVSGVAAAWVNFNGTGTIAVRDSENVASLTDNGVGDHSVNFSSSFATSNYGASGFAGNDNVDGTVWVTAPANVARSTWKQTGLMRIAVSYQNTLVTDSQEVCLTCHGDLA